MDYAVDLALRWLHIFSATALVGGTLYWRFALLPATSQLSSEQDAFLDKLRSGWARIVMLSSGFLLISGVFNAVRIIMRYDLPTSYHMLVGVKLLLALAMMWLSATLAGRSQLARKFREQARLWLTVNVLLAVVLVGLAGVMKLTDRSPKPETTVTMVDDKSSAKGQTPILLK